jgi:2-amino-4-hydroxy-6-hydroxymethyldihydropteridine diphosphokinase
MAITFLSIGSNSGDRSAYLQQSVKLIEQKIGRIIRRSDVYETQSWGYEGQNFLNMVVEVETTFAPQKIIEIIQSIEIEMGRVRLSGQYSDRTIDLDILFYEKEIISDENLIIPHPRLHERMFALEPMMDIDPDFRHPVLNKTIRQLRMECPDKGWIRKLLKR